MFKRIVRQKLLRKKLGASTAGVDTLYGDAGTDTVDSQSEAHVCQIQKENEELIVAEESDPIDKVDLDTAEKEVGWVEEIDVKVKPRQHLLKKRQREDFHDVKEGDENKGKRVREVLRNGNQTSEAVDWISQLPDHIIGHILSFIPNQKDVLRTSILSKRWRHAWQCLSALMFDLNMFIPRHRRLSRLGTRCYDRLGTYRFKDYVYKALKTHIGQNHHIEKLVFRVPFCHVELFPHLEYWIETAVDNGVRELDLCTTNGNHPSYAVPPTIFNVKTLTVLRLIGCSLHACKEINLPHLQKLYLRQLYIDHDIIQNLFSGCPAIKDLRLIKCRGSRVLKVFCLSRLYRVEVHQCIGLKRIEINASQLETFWYCSKSLSSCKLNLTGCSSIKRLTLESITIASDVLLDLLSAFPILESLDLSKCNRLKSIMIFSPMLKRLSLRGCKNVNAVWMNCCLESFEYKGEKMPLVEIKTISFLREAKLHFAPAQLPKFGIVLKDEDTRWFSRVGEFIKNFDPAKQFKLVARSTKNVIVHEDLNEILLPPVSDLRLEIIKPSVNMAHVLDYFMRIWHPKTLSIVSSSDSQVSQLVHTKIMNREEDPVCCGYNTVSNKCWKHFIRNAQLEDMEADKVAVGAATEKRTFDWITWLKSSKPKEPYRLDTYTLYWNYEKISREQH